MAGKCKLMPKGVYDADFCKDAGGQAKQCQSCGNNPELKKK